MAKAWSKMRELTGMICDKKVPTKMKLLIYQTVIGATLLYGGRNMANISERLKAYGNNSDGNGAMSNGGEPVRTTKT